MAIGTGICVASASVTERAEVWREETKKLYFFEYKVWLSNVLLGA